MAGHERRFRAVVIAALMVAAAVAYALAIDPVELRIRNHAARDEQHDPHQLVGSSALDDRLERPAPHRVVSEANYPRVKR